MSWNYRVMRHVYPAEKCVSGEDYIYYTIHEVYYGTKDNPDALSWSTNPDWPQAESVEELRDELNRMLAALDKPVLEYGDEIRESDKAS